jgi:hypothetical protein
VASALPASEHSSLAITIAKHDTSWMVYKSALLKYLFLLGRLLEKKWKFGRGVVLWAEFLVPAPHTG